MFRPVIIVPCFNHADAFASVAKRIAEYKVPVIVVDDGSDVEQSKKLKDICSGYTFIYTRRDKNGGKGAAMITGFRKAAEYGFSNAIQIDADGQHNTNDIARFLELAKKSPDALIMGQPVYDSSAPKSRLAGRKITNFWVAIETLNRHMPDTMCGFRVYPIALTNKILSSIHFLRMGFDIEIVVKLYRAGVKIITTDTRVIYPESGVSHFHLWRDNFYISLMHIYLCCGLPMWLLTKWGAKMKKLFLLTVFLCGTANAQNITEMPTRLKNFTDNLGTVSANFNQSKTMPESVKTFHANGTVKFVKGAGFKWTQIKPNSFEFTSTLDSYCVNDEKKALASLPYFSQIQSMINDMLNGDMTMFLMAFNADYSESKKGTGWTLMATPKVPAIADFLEAITFAGDIKDLHQMVIIYKNGTTVTINFKRMTVDLPDEIKC